MIKLVLFDINEEMVSAWRKYFSDLDNVKILWCALSDLEVDKVVTAGNSYGWMTGGIDLAVRRFFGITAQDLIQQQIICRYAGFLPVGESIEIQTHSSQIPHLIYAPTMDVPKKITAADVFYVFAKILEKYDEEIAVCGLGANTGGVNADSVARAMRAAWDFVNEREI